MHEDYHRFFMPFNLSLQSIEQDEISGEHQSEIRQTSAVERNGEFTFLLEHVKHARSDARSFHPW